MSFSWLKRQPTQMEATMYFLLLSSKSYLSKTVGKHYHVTKNFILHERLLDNLLYWYCCQNKLGLGIIKHYGGYRTPSLHTSYLYEQELKLNHVARVWQNAMEWLMKLLEIMDDTIYITKIKIITTPNYQLPNCWPTVLSQDCMFE